jgi:hypothetical protein
MKRLPLIAGILLGLLFAVASIPVLLNLVPAQKFPAGTPVAAFYAAFWPTHYILLVKVVELTGAVLVAIPRTRNWGLLALGPVIVNILAFHILINHGEGLANPMVIAVVVLALYLLWHARQKFAGLLN